MLRGIVIGHYFEQICDLLVDLLYFWDNSDTERVVKINGARKRALDCHDDLMLDSAKNHMLFATDTGFHLVSRRDAWKVKLSEEELSLYEKKGRRAFPMIERASKR